MGDYQGTITLTKTITAMDVVERLRDFVENEARSCSMDYGCVTPSYVYRMWGGAVTLEDIEVAMKVLKKHKINE